MHTETEQRIETPATFAVVGAWNGWRVVIVEGVWWKVNPITGHRVRFDVQS